MSGTLLDRVLFVTGLQAASRYHRKGAIIGVKEEAGAILCFMIQQSCSSKAAMAATDV